MIESRSTQALRRVMDVTIAAIAIVPLSPIMAAIAVAIRRDSPGPAIFTQVRVGRHGRPFVMYKFRTMRADSRPGFGVTSRGDNRVTPVGAFLRSTKLDELPQLVNVLKGDMAFVGPRPELSVFVDQWPLDLRETILSIRPGITDPMTLSLRREEDILASVPDPQSYYRSVLLPQKAVAYAKYVESRTLAGDLGILARTLRHVVFG